MKKTISMIGLLLCTSLLSGQSYATFRLGSTDASTLSPGDLVYVPVYCDDISGPIYTLQMFISYDHDVLSWNGSFGNPLTGVQNFNPGFPYGTVNGSWMFNDNGTSLVALWDDPTGNPGSIDPGETFFELIFTYLGGETALAWGPNSGCCTVMTLVNGCVCSPIPHPIVFNVTSAGANFIENAAVTVGNETSMTNGAGNAVFYRTDGNYTYTVNKENYQTVTGQFTVTGSMLLIEVIMEPGELYGVTFFVNCCGEPQEGVVIFFGGYTFITGGNGVFMANLPEGNYLIWIGDYLFNFTLPGTTYIDANICRELTYHVISDQGFPLENVIISMGSNNLMTDSNGEADTCLQVGSYNYSASKPGFITQTGTIEMDTIPQTVEIVMPAETWGLTFLFSGIDCENEFEELIVIINGDTVLPGETINLANGTYYYSVVLIGCGIQYDGPVAINNAPATVYLYAPGLPRVTFHVTDQFFDDFIGAVINVEEDILITDTEGIASFCMTGGFHEYWVANPGYDTIPNNFVFPCQDTTIEVMLMVGSIGEDKMTSLNVYPNPSSGKFSIENLHQTGESTEIFVTDMTGRVVYQTSTSNLDKTEIDISDRPKGLYFVRIRTNEMEVNSKVVVQ